MYCYHEKILTSWHAARSLFSLCFCYAWAKQTIAKTPIFTHKYSTASQFFGWTIEKWKIPNYKYGILFSGRKAFLYKRVIKLDTSTGDAWVLHSVTTSKGEKRTWVPLEHSP